MRKITSAFLHARVMTLVFAACGEEQVYFKLVRTQLRRNTVATISIPTHSIGAKQCVTNFVPFLFLEP